MEKKDYWELEKYGEVISKLVSDPEIFNAVLEAFDKLDPQKFQEMLKELGIARHCKIICRWLCLKRCVLFCGRLGVPPSLSKPEDLEEIRSFGETIDKIIKDKETLDKLMEYYEKQDVERFREILRQRELIPFSSQLCHWICYIKCKKRCKILCPRPPYITHLGFIPTAQITSEGYAMGPSQPPGTTPPPTSCQGHHSFGGVVNIKGKFSITNPEKYKVEWAPDMAGPWTIITTPLSETDFSVSPPVIRTRYASGPPEPGWYEIAEMIDKSYLTDWNTPSDTTKKFYLRLTVKNSFGTSYQSPIEPIRVDNENPEIEVLDLFIKKPDGTEEAIKCGRIRKGSGTIVIKIKAWDRNFRQLTLTAEGGCHINIPIKDEVTGTLVSRCYDGNLSDRGEPTLRVVEWDPWKMEKVIPCCYNVVLRIWDRTIIDNSYARGHVSVDWESIQIGLA